MPGHAFNFFKQVFSFQLVANVTDHACFVCIVTAIENSHTVKCEFTDGNNFPRSFWTCRCLHMGNQCRYRQAAQVPTSQNRVGDEDT